MVDTSLPGPVSPAQIGLFLIIDRLPDRTPIAPSPCTEAVLPMGDRMERRRRSWTIASHSNGFVEAGSDATAAAIHGYVVVADGGALGGLVLLYGVGLVADAHAHAGSCDGNED